jgi:hypothetical protein
MRTAPLRGLCAVGLRPVARREWPWRANFGETPPREWPSRANFNETPPRERRSRANFSETTSWTPSQPIWPAAGQRRTAGPSSVRRDRRSRRNSWSVGVGSDQPLRPLARKLAESGRLSPSSRKLLDNEVTLPRAPSGTYSMKARGVQSSSVQTETFTSATQSRGGALPHSPASEVLACGVREVALPAEQRFEFSARHDQPAVLQRALHPAARALLDQQWEWNVSFTVRPSPRPGHLRIGR